MAALRADDSQLFSVQNGYVVAEKKTKGDMVTAMKMEFLALELIKNGFQHRHVGILFFL